MAHSAPSQTAATARKEPILWVLRKIPVVRHVIRDIERDQTTIYYLLVALLTVLVLCIKAWGVVALAMAALIMVPIMFICLIAITLG